MRLALLTASLVLGSVFALNAQPAPALRIVILEGEDAVNIIQQTTAVRAPRDVCRRRANAHGCQLVHQNDGGHGGPSTLTFTTTVPVGAFTYRVAYDDSLAGNTTTWTFALEVVQGATGSTRLPVTLQK